MGSLSSESARTRYHAALSHSPSLVDALAQECESARASFDLRDEAALARTLLSQVLAQMAKLHGENGKLDGNLFGAIMHTLKQVSGIVEQAAAIEAKRGDQFLDAARVAILVGNLRDEITRKLEQAGYGDATSLVADCFMRAKWTAGLDEKVVQEALNAPTSYDVVFRVIEKAANGKPVETSEIVRAAQQQQQS